MSWCLLRMGGWKQLYGFLYVTDELQDDRFILIKKTPEARDQQLDVGCQWQQQLSPVSWLPGIA